MRSARWSRSAPTATTPSADQGVLAGRGAPRQGHELLEVLPGVWLQLEVVRVLVAIIAVELAALAFGGLDRRLHHLLRLGATALGTRLRDRRVALGGDGAGDVGRRAGPRDPQQAHRGDGDVAHGEKMGAAAGRASP